MTGRAALLQAKALRAKAAALGQLLLLPAKVVLRLLASTALMEARPGHLASPGGVPHWSHAPPP